MREFLSAQMEEVTRQKNQRAIWARDTQLAITNMGVPNSTRLPRLIMRREIKGEVGKTMCAHV